MSQSGMAGIICFIAFEYQKKVFFYKIIENPFTVQF